jgi:AraC-like DNA-binding protein
MKIYEIGEQVGYRSAQHFISEFRKAVGVTPKAYQTAKR